MPWQHEDYGEDCSWPGLLAHAGRTKRQKPFPTPAFLSFCFYFILKTDAQHATIKLDLLRLLSPSQ
jgi:hypothetical protein